ncbi:unnamed protein product [Prorocentrum cordatum]|uniref:Uncharacterized protein n=1 Tax=Prorocentrum cordatum TaxID=2364126 RepID=A0ABN9UBS3_9DINO|nr:unnamed protein product [Polarella glacialis]
MYAARMEMQFDQLRARGLPFPDKWMHLFMEEGVGLDDSGKQMLGVLARGWGKHKDLPSAIRELDLSKTESLSSAGRAPKSHAVEATEESQHALLEDDEASDTSLDTEMENEISMSIDAADIGEEEAPTVLLEIAGERRKTWKENKDQKRPAKVNRRFILLRLPHRPRSAQRGLAAPREALRQVSSRRLRRGDHYGHRRRPGPHRPGVAATLGAAARFARFQSSESEKQQRVSQKGRGQHSRFCFQVFWCPWTSRDALGRWK